MAIDPMLFLYLRKRLHIRYLKTVANKDVARKKIERGPNFATFNVTSFTYYGILK